MPHCLVFRVKAKKREINEKSEDKNQGRAGNSDQSKSSERGRSDSSRNDRGRDRSRSRDLGMRRGNEGSEADRRRRREVLAQMASSLDQELEEGGVPSDATTQPVKLDLRLQAKQQPKSKGFQSREFVEEGEEQAAKKSRTIIPIDYTEEEKMAVLSIQDQVRDDNCLFISWLRSDSFARFLSLLPLLRGLVLRSQNLRIE